MLFVVHTSKRVVARSNVYDVFLAMVYVPGAAAVDHAVDPS